MLCVYVFSIDLVLLTSFHVMSIIRFDAIFGHVGCHTSSRPELILLDFQTLGTNWILEVSFFYNLENVDWHTCVGCKFPSHCLCSQLFYTIRIWKGLLSVGSEEQIFKWLHMFFCSHMSTQRRWIQSSVRHGTLLMTPPLIHPWVIFRHRATPSEHSVLYVVGWKEADTLIRCNYC